MLHLLGKEAVNAGPAESVPIKNLNLTMFVRDTAWDFMPTGNSGGIRQKNKSVYLTQC